MGQLDMFQQPFHRAQASRGLNLGHLGQLFGDMDMHRHRGAQPCRDAQAMRRRRAQRMGCRAHVGIGAKVLHMRRRPLPQPGKAVRVVAEPPLAFVQRPPVAAAPLIQHRQQRQPQPGLLRRRRDPPRHLGQIVIGAGGRVVQIMELGHGGITGLGHFHHHHGGNGLRILGRQAAKEAIHQLAPGPEAVIAPILQGGPAPLGQPSHRALEGVGMQVDHGGQQAIHT